VVRPRVDGGETPAAWWRSDERGQIDIEGEGANRGAYRVAGVEAKLTRVTDMAGTRWWPRNKSETMANG
jgi:hypothetical protein